MSKCKYCGKKIERGEVCGNCSIKLKRVRELVKISQRIKNYRKAVGAKVARPP